MESPYKLLLAVLLVVSAPLYAQQPAAPAQGQGAAAPAAKSFSQQQLDELLAPIALYPDALLAQILMASTYPLEVVEAARWQKANSKLTGKALEDALQTLDWDPAVKSLTAVPQVLTMMNEKLDWTQKLGDAFLAQQEDVMKTAQSLRSKAAAAGTLKTTPEQVVKTEQQAGTTVYIIEPAKTEVVYVPTYNPAVVYGTWWYPTPPPYYYAYPGYPYGAGLAFAGGVAVGAALWGNCGWGNNEININRNNYNNFNRTNVQNNKFQHNADHRKGVSYKDGATAQKYGKGGDSRAAQSREGNRGYDQGGRQQAGAGDRGGAGASTSAANRGGGDAGRGGGDAGRGGGGASTSAANRGGGGGASTSAASRSGGGGGGFSGASSGASTRAASSRGSASRGGGGGGGGRGGGGRR